MYDGTFTYIYVYHKIGQTVGKHSLHEAFGHDFLWWLSKLIFWNSKSNMVDMIKTLSHPKCFFVYSVGAYDEIVHTQEKWSTTCQRVEDKE